MRKRRFVLPIFGQIAVLRVPLRQSLPLEIPAHAQCQGLSEPDKLGAGRCLQPAEAQRAVGTLDIHPSGLLGRHSGVDINKGRANANYLVAQALSGFESLRLIDFAGARQEMPLP